MVMAVTNYEKQVIMSVNCCNLGFSRLKSSDGLKMVRSEGRRHESINNNDREHYQYYQ